MGKSAPARKGPTRDGACGPGTGVAKIAVAAFLRGAQYRQTTNAPTPPDDVILSKLGQDGILPADGRCPNCDSRGPVGSVCRGHDAPAADPYWRGPIRVAPKPAGTEGRKAHKQDQSAFGGRGATDG